MDVGLVLDGRICVHDQGHIVEQGPAKTLFTAPQHERTRQFLSKFLNA